MAAEQAAAADRDALRVPVRGLTVLYDPDCSLCAFLRDWLGRQPQLVPLEFLPAASAEACARFPGLDHRATLDEITVVGDSGQVYTGAAAWIVTLWALREHRPMSHRLSTPAGAKVARAVVLAAAKWRDGQGAGWGGGVYRRGDGWSYDPYQGWAYNPPTCADGSCSTR
ncbi:DCC1-like thiol-disulfide oxidoreductase family protein [Streptomyces sp. NPDC006872]|uniref:thiol-disulfide oxidoreductase DCC family protein n=1 Tax=Streptomyces sp. NPDC006872 TaxID=3155720 RepID=UPI00340DFEEA